MGYEFQTNQSAPQMATSWVNYHLTLPQVSGLLQTLTTCDTPLPLKNFYFNLVQLAQFNDEFKASKIYIPDDISQNLYWQDLTLEQRCRTRTWVVGLGERGVWMFVLSNRFSDFIVGFSIITLYTSVILVLGRLLRGGLAVQTGDMPFKYCPHPEAMAQFCQSITLARKQARY